MSNSGYILKLVSVRFAEGTEMSCERMQRIMGEVKTFDKIIEINSGK